MAKQLKTKMQSFMSLLDKNEWGYELYEGSGEFSDKVIVFGYHVEVTNERFYIVDQEGDDIYSAVKTQSVLNKIEKLTEGGK